MKQFNDTLDHVAETYLSEGMYGDFMKGVRDFNKQVDSEGLGSALKTVAGKAYHGKDYEWEQSIKKHWERMHSPQQNKFNDVNPELQRWAQQDPKRKEWLNLKGFARFRMEQWAQQNYDSKTIKDMGITRSQLPTHKPQVKIPPEQVSKLEQEWNKLHPNIQQQYTSKQQFMKIRWTQQQNTGGTS